LTTTSGQGRLDAATLEVLRSRLQATAEEGAITIERTAISPVIAESRDYSCTLLEANGDLIVAGGAITHHFGVCGHAVRATLAKFGDTIAPGDMFFANDPHNGGGLHAQDVLVQLPVFAGDRLIAWVVNSGHMLDMGGLTFGSWSPEAVDCYQEALRLPPVRLSRAGAEQSDVWDIIRNNVRVPGLAAWDEVARALTGSPPASPDADAMFAAMAASTVRDDSALTAGDAEQPLTEEEAAAAAALAQTGDDENDRKLTVPMKIRLATLGDAFERAKRIRDPIRMVAMAAIKAPGVTDIEAARYASNQALAEDVIRYIAGNRNWTKLYGVKVSLCRNPKAPIAETTRFLPFLRQKDLVNLSKSKSVPSALAAQARKLVMQRGGR